MWIWLEISLCGRWIFASWLDYWKSHINEFFTSKIAGDEFFVNYCFGIFITGRLVASEEQENSSRRLHSIKLCRQIEVNRSWTVSSQIIFNFIIYQAKTVAYNKSSCYSLLLRSKEQAKKLRSQTF